MDTPSTWEAEHLNVAAADPIVRVRGVSFDADGNGLRLLRTVLSRCEIHVLHRRSDPAPHPRPVGAVELVGGAPDRAVMLIRRTGGYATGHEQRTFRQAIAFLVAPEGIEQVELTEPWEAVEQAGGTPELVSTEVGKIQAFNHLTPADTFEADKAADDVSAADYDALVLPGGVANPDFLRTKPARGRLRRRVSSTPASRSAVICHGPWTLVEADVVAGPHDHVVAESADRSAQRRRELGGRGGGGLHGGPNTLVSSRKPDDLPAFCAKLVQAFADWARVSVTSPPCRERRADRGTARPAVAQAPIRHRDRRHRTGVRHDPGAHRPGQRLPASRPPARSTLSACDAFLVKSRSHRTVPGIVGVPRHQAPESPGCTDRRSTGLRQRHDADRGNRTQRQRVRRTRAGPGMPAVKEGRPPSERARGRGVETP